MQQLTDEGRRIVDDVARRRGFSSDAVTTMLIAVSAGYGNQAQFNHPEFGGMGQWSSGGMIMIGDMFNNYLKDRVGSLCQELAGLIQGQPLFSEPAQGRSSPRAAAGRAKPAAAISNKVAAGAPAEAFRAQRPNRQLVARRSGHGGIDRRTYQSETLTSPERVGSPAT